MIYISPYQTNLEISASKTGMKQPMQKTFKVQIVQNWPKSAGSSQTCINGALFENLIA